LNKASFLRTKGFFYYTFSISSLAHWTKKWTNTVAWLNEYSSMEEAMRHGKDQGALRFLEHKLQLCQLSSSSSSSRLVGGWSLRREETREVVTGQSLMSSRKPCTNFHKTPHACLMLLGCILETYWIHHHHHDVAEFCAILKVTTDALSPNQYCFKILHMYEMPEFFVILKPWFLMILSGILFTIA
jgi:uncharacterized protein involved in tolerance to divalent cations